MPRLMPMRFAASAGLVLLAAVFGCQKTEQAKQQPRQLVPVKTAKVRLMDIAETLEYAGSVRAQDEALVYPKVSGKIIEKIKQDGDPVAKGEHILYIDRDEVGLKFEKAPVESPLTGVVGRVFVDKGQNVDPQTAVALVVNMDRVKVALDIPEVYLPRVLPGQNASITLDAYPGKIFTGQINKVSPVLDATTRSSPVEIIADNPGHLLNSGMFVKVSLNLTEHKAVAAILKEGIIGYAPDTYCFVIEDNKAVLRKIALGIRQGQYYEVTSGLKEGDPVVVLGQQRLREGSEVITEEQEQE